MVTVGLSKDDFRGCDNWSSDTSDRLEVNSSQPQTETSVMEVSCVTRNIGFMNVLPSLGLRLPYDTDTDIPPRTIVTITWYLYYLLTLITRSWFCKVLGESQLLVSSTPEGLTPSSDDFEVIDQLEGRLPPKDLMKVQAWLQPTDCEAESSEYHRHLCSQAPGTGLWICETSKYEKWHNSGEHGSLWIKGVPGAGKSVTAASLVAHLRKTNENTPILHFFFRYIIAANRHPRNLIKDFLAQLLPYSTPLQATLQPMIGTELDDFSDERMWETLLDGLTSIKKAYCVVDALDEMELLPNDDFLNQLNNLAAFRPEAIKIMITSRPKQYLQSGLRDTSIIHISLENDLISKEISLFLEYRLKKVLPQDDQKRFLESLATTISERSRGLFLYARLLIDQITPILTSKEVDVERLTNNLPVGLEEMYNSMLEKQAASLSIDIRIQVFLLELVTHSSRALRLNELASILASNFPASMIQGSPKVIARSACAPLLEVLEDETVQVIHHSFTEFLISADRAISNEPNRRAQFPVLDPDNVHKRLTIVCLDYLTSGTLRVPKPIVIQSVYSKPSNPDDKKESQYDYQEAKLGHPFLEYAVGNWAFHASKFDREDEDFLRSITNFLNPECVDFEQWVELEWAKGAGFSRSRKNRMPAPLHIAAFAGLTTYARMLLTTDLSVDPLDALKRTPLHWACSRGHHSMASILLESGAVPDVEDRRGVKPIHEAARKNHSSIVKMLLDAGVDPLSPKTRENVTRRLMCGEISTIGETAVEYAYLQGHTNTILALIPYIASETLVELFCQCCRYGRFEAVKSILDTTEVSPNSEIDGATALYLACRAKNVAMVDLLLSKGADVHRTSQWTVRNRNSCGSRKREEPLRENTHAIVIGWKDENNTACQHILRLLLCAGADLEAKDGDGNTPLLSLFYDKSHFAPDKLVLQSLLEAGANVLATDGDGDSVLHHHLKGPKNIQILELLFEYGASAHSLGHDGDTILHSALNNYCCLEGTNQCTTEIVKSLLERGAQCNVQNKHGNTPVDTALGSWVCSLETFTVLLRACSDHDALKASMWKLRARKNAKETIEFVRALQTIGVSLEDRNENGETVLLKNVGDQDLFDTFLACGADLRAVDLKGQGVLHHYVSELWYKSRDCRPLQWLTRMVNLGLKPDQIDYAGNNLLHVLANKYKGKGAHDLFIEKLLDYGISINAKNGTGMTPLHIYLENWDFSRPITTTQKDLNERFDEKHGIRLLEVFRRGKEVLDMDSQDIDGITLLHLAALRSETRMVYLIEQGADPSILTRMGRNVLHLACRARESNVVGYLCHRYKEMVNLQDSFGRTPLHDACTSGRPESVRLLLEAGADVGILDKNKRTPLHACAEFADEQRIWTLLARQNETLGYLLNDRFRPIPSKPLSYDLWYTRKRNSARSAAPHQLGISLVVKTLLSAESKTLCLDSLYQTPLDLAIQYDCQEMVQALEFSAEEVQRSREIVSDDPRLRTVIALKSRSLSTTNLQDSILQELFKNLLTYLPLLNFDDIKWISGYRGNIAGASGQDLSSPGLTSMYIAASHGYVELMQNFNFIARLNDQPQKILARIQEFSKDPQYDPAIQHLSPMLHVACARQLPNLEMVETLVQHCKVDINARALVKPEEHAHIKKSIVGGTALHTLAKSNYWWQLAALEYLIKKGAQIDSLNEKGETPLHVACTGPTYADLNYSNKIYGYWRIETVKILLDLGGDLHLLDNDGLSCLHKASSSPQIMRLLLEHGADPTAGNFSPIFSAIQMQCLETLTILLDAKVSPNALCSSTENDGFQLHYLVRNLQKSALLCACFADLHNQQDEGSISIVKLLIHRGANIYALLDDKETVIHYVFENAEYEIVSAFLDSSSEIDLTARDFHGRTIFLAACDWVKRHKGYTTHMWSPKETAHFLRLNELGVDPLVVDYEGRNALHHLLDNTAMEEQAIVEFLTQHEAAKTLLHQKDGQGFTPLDCALRFLRPAVVEVLLIMGANLLTPDPTGATALHHIASQCVQHQPRSKEGSCGEDHTPEYYTGLHALWKKYLSLGGCINVRDRTGSPPLFSYLSSIKRDNYKEQPQACRHLDDYPTYFSLSLAPDLDLHATNDKGENALHIIARREAEPEIRYLKIARDAVKEKKRTKKERYDRSLFEGFVGRGLDPLREDGRGRSSLDLAAACGQRGILELFRCAMEGSYDERFLRTSISLVNLAVHICDLGLWNRASGGASS
ncbi:ankyrin repeat-containing domain protein [Amylocarpus encephaloides]|uniref:Ankyrin repeat-containing domain protein n=1 Tax=Amylocarpus encephaloides TaxID=45428 RepID=A0A9P8C525_9HELO|nr:ankyrin repeat-containing domain protein [Amylocarpus encephaloides]